MAVASAVLTIPSVLLDFWFAGAEEADYSLLNAGFHALLVAVFVFYISVFRRLLHAKAGFHEVDTPISILIWVSVAVAALDVFGSAGSMSADVINTLILPAAILLAIVTAVFGYKLRDCSDALFGYRDTIGWLSIITGVCAATIVLIPIALGTSIAADIVIAMVLFMAKRELEQTGALQREQ